MVVPDERGSGTAPCGGAEATAVAAAGDVVTVGVDGTEEGMVAGAVRMASWSRSEEMGVEKVGNCCICGCVVINSGGSR